MADDYCEIARNYLKPICRYGIRIDVLKERLDTLRGCLTLIGRTYLPMLMSMDMRTRK